jgi:AhpD family alkylhydroperoxidase
MRTRLIAPLAAAGLMLLMAERPGRTAVATPPGPRVTLAAADAPALRDLGMIPGVPPGQTPDVVRALGAALPDTVKPFARLYRTVLYGGTVAPEVKMAMGLAVARETRAPYVAAHMTRLLAGRKGDTRTAAAVDYAARLTRDIHGVDTARFAALRAHYNDAQIVELTMATCFFNYFARLSTGLNLSPEPWTTEAVVAPVGAVARERAPAARVTLASDEEIAAAAESVKPGVNIMGFFPNSKRAMLRTPDLMDAWFGYWTAVRRYQSVSTPEKLQVSFAVSMANGCRYCTLHQVSGLRRAGVDAGKLVAMRKDDAALTAREKAAVAFARHLTLRPGPVPDALWSGLTREMGEQGAVEVLLQTCAFNFMNRFTDGLRLPSESEAILVYDEVYGGGAYNRFYPEADRRRTVQP